MMNSAFFYEKSNYHQPFGSIFSDHLTPKKDDSQEDKPMIDTIPFKETTTLEIKNPEVQMEQISHESDQKQQQLKLLQLDVEAVKNKIAASQQYTKLLIEYLNFSEKDRNKIKALVADKANYIKDLITSKKLQKIATKTQIQNAMLDTKINHLKITEKLKKEGINVKGSQVLKFYRPVQEKVTTVLPTTTNIPKIEGKVPTDQLYTLTQLGQIDESYFGKFKESLATPQSLKDAKKFAYQKSHLPKKIEQTLLLNKQIDWKMNSLNKEKTEQLKLYNNEKTKVADLIKRITISDPGAKSAITAVGILVDNNPKNFEDSSLLNSLPNSLLQKGSQLGQISSDSSQLSIAQAAQNVQTALLEQQAKQNTLLQFTTGAPKPSPDVISVPVITINTTALLKKFLPWIIGILIVLNLLK